ncbi:MAG: TetR/AcrR family transcriptional regulator [Pseudomonadales bacterium]
MKPARKDGLETKKRLIDTAERLFVEQGVERVKLVDVSREAGQKNRNAAQYHFGDRVGLINAVLNKHSDMIAQARQAMLDQLEQQQDVTLRELIEAQVLPIASHVRSHPNGWAYLMLNRQLINSSEHIGMSLQRINDRPEVLRLQRLMRPFLPAQSADALRAKMILLHCMLFNGLANFYDLEPETDSQNFVDTLCACMVAVLLADSG